LIHGSHVELIATPGSAQHPSIAGNAVRLPLGPSPKRVSFKGYATLITRKTHHRSPKRKLATTLVGGPLGYMLFGRSTRLEQGREAPLAVTNRAVYFDDERIPSYKIDGTRKGHYPNSIILLLDNKGKEHSSKNSTSKLELKTDDVEQLAESLKNVVDHPNPNASPVTMEAR